MPHKVLGYYLRLTRGEQASLKTLCATGTGEDIPTDHATRLLRFGLAELHCGDLGPTGPARVMVRAQVAT